MNGSPQPLAPFKYGVSTRNYNMIRSVLVQKENDIVGHVAYSIYKQQKIDYIKDFKSKQGREPSEEDLNTFHTHCNLNHSIQSYKTKAETLVQTLMQNVINQYQLDSEELVRKIVKEEAMSKTTTVLLGVCSSFAFAFLISSILFIGSFSENGNVIVDWIKKIFT